MENVKEAVPKTKSFLIPLITSTLFAAFLPIFMYTNNIEEAGFIEVLPALLLLTAAGAVIFLIAFLCTKKNAFLSTVASVIIILMLSNFSFLQKLIVKLNPYMLEDLGLVFRLALAEAFFIIIIAVYLIDRFTKKLSGDIKETVPLVLLIVISALIALNIVTALPAGIKKLTVPEIAENPAASGTVTTDEQLPNVYYLIFDEYSNSEMMKKYFDYDNAGFDRYLEDKGFSVSPNTQNGSIDTTVIITNYMNYDYVVDTKTSASDKAWARENNGLIKLAASNGYDIVGVGSSIFVGVPSVTESDYMGASTMGGDSLGKVILSNTVFNVFLDSSDNGLTNNINNAIGYFNEKNLTENSKSDVFVTAYICSPHEPFLFDENGNTPTHLRYGWNDEAYLGQYIYITKMMEQIVDNILKYDEDSVIILQSDHGARFGEGLEANVTEDKMKPLNAVYFRGEDISEIKGQSGVNTIRLVLNRLFGMDLEILPVKE